MWQEEEGGARPGSRGACSGEQATAAADRVQKGADYGAPTKKMTCLFLFFLIILTSGPGYSSANFCHLSNDEWVPHVSLGVNSRSDLDQCNLRGLTKNVVVFCD